MTVFDMMNNFNDLANLYNRLRQNPGQVLASKFNIPTGVNINDPNSIIQHLLNTGQISQSQVNQIMNSRNNPVIQRLFGMK